MTVALHSMTGRTFRLDVDRWRSDADAFECELLDSVADPLLDIGCGPGRIAAAVAAAGRVALGIDPSALAVAEARRRGAPVLQRSVFEPLPGEGRWATAVLFDGNVGIGGQPAVLLKRVARLLRTGGEALVEVEPPGVATETMMVRLQRRGTVSPLFAWAQVGADQVPALGRAAGLSPLTLDGRAGRWFARLRKP